MAAIPKVGPVLRHAIPVANYHGRYPLTKEQIREWAVLDTFDWFSPEYEKPQRKRTIERWFSEIGLKDIHVERTRHYLDALLESCKPALPHPTLRAAPKNARRAVEHPRFHGLFEPFGVTTIPPHECARGKSQKRN